MRRKSKLSALAAAFSAGALSACFMPTLMIFSLVTLLLILAVLTD